LGFLAHRLFRHVTPVRLQRWRFLASFWSDPPWKMTGFAALKLSCGLTDSCRDKSHWLGWQ
ncbi:MAG: hypothetical protein WD005_06220, partial [Haliea sp.]